MGGAAAASATFFAHSESCVRSAHCSALYRLDTTFWFVYCRPTGHPAIMRDPSSDLAEIVNEYEKKLSGNSAKKRICICVFFFSFTYFLYSPCFFYIDLRIDNETAENTEINKRVPPSIQREEEKEKSPRSEKRTVSMAHDA